MERDILEFWKQAPEDPFDVFFEHAPILMHSIDAEGRLQKVSRRWAETLGYDRDEMIGRKSVEFLTDASRDKAQTVVLPKFLETGTLENVEYEFVRKDGSIMPVVMSASSVLDKKGEFIRSLAIMFDNSEAVQARAELTRKAAEAEEASRAKSRFLAAMSHEIRTPMNAIMGFAQLLQLSNLDETRRSHVRSILSAGGTLMNLLTDLLDLSLVEEGRMRVEKRPFELSAMLDQVSDWWCSSAREKGLKLTVASERGIPDRIVSDPGRLQQVLNNFLGNAVKFTDAGRISLSLEMVARDGDTARLRFEVSDTGPGMDAEQIALLFKPFVQIEADFGKERGGWGLGLSICHNIAEALDAEIGVTSEVGQGSVFFFELPVEIAEPEQPAPTRGPAAPPAMTASKALRVLLAEDNAMNQDILRTILHDMGHEVATAANGHEAVDLLGEDRFDLVLMDIMMPGLDGLGATRKIRENADFGDKIPIVACSAHVSKDAQQRYLKAGMDAFVPKPVDRNTLARVIDDVMLGGAT
ncbi:MAG: response regulator [Pseudomonadota bacterium]